MKTKGAYTLIEVLVGLVILGLLTQVGMAGYRQFNRRQLAATTLSQLEGNLRLAQQHANSSTRPAGFVCSGLDSFVGVEFEMVSRTQYSISALCSNGTKAQLKQVQLPSTVALVRPAESTIIFEPLAQGIAITSDVVIGVCAYGTEKQALKLTQTGEISQTEISTCDESSGVGAPGWCGTWLENLLCFLFYELWGNSCPCSGGGSAPTPTPTPTPAPTIAPTPTPTPDPQSLLAGKYIGLIAYNGKYVRFQNVGLSSELNADSSTFGVAEKFLVQSQGDGTVALLASNSQYVAVETTVGGTYKLYSNGTSIDSTKKYNIVSAGSGKIAIIAAVNSRYVRPDPSILKAAPSFTILDSQAVFTYTIANNQCFCVE